MKDDLTNSSKLMPQSDASCSARRAVQPDTGVGATLTAAAARKTDVKKTAGIETIGRRCR